jgi:retron-type reverse transcriptase
MHQNPIEQMELALETTGEARQSQRSGEAGPTARGTERSGSGGPMDLMERIVERSNLARALKRVRQNQGSAGVDGMTVDDLVPYLTQHWGRLREELLTGRYQPSAVRQHQIPKGDGRMRTVGIPTVLDRFIQQAVLQVLQPQFDPTFSESSYGFRPGRRAHDAVRQAQRYGQSGRRWVVDVDREQFFDRVNHEVLMGKLSQRITDRRVLALVRRYLEAGMMAHGVVQERYEGTPQGGPLSPLLANVLFDDVYVRSKRAGERVMEALVGLYAKLRLRVNSEKSAVARVWDRQFLGFSLWVAPGRGSNSALHRRL